MSSLNVDGNDLLEEQVTEAVDGIVADVEEDEEGVTIPLTEEMIKQGQQAYEKAVLDAATPEKLEEYKSTIIDFCKLADEHENFVLDKFKTKEMFPAEELAFDMSNESVKKYSEEIRPILTFLVDKEVLDAKYLDDVKVASDKLHRAEILKSAISNSGISTKPEVVDSLYQTMFQVVYGAATLQVENALKTLVIFRKNDRLDIDTFNETVESIKNIYKTHKEYLDANGLTSDQLSFVEKLTLEVLEHFKPSNV